MKSIDELKGPRAKKKKRRRGSAVPQKTLSGGKRTEMWLPPRSGSEDALELQNLNDMFT